MKITYFGHACIMIESRGKRILMDPWLVDPTYHGTWWHYPPLRLGVKDVPKLDYIYISHEHPDHFDPPTLEQLDKSVEIIIPDFKKKRFRDRIRAIGFQRITELPFGVARRCDESGLTLQLIEPDRAWDDSAILVKNGETTVLNVNDCHLDEQTLRRLGNENQIDLAFLTFTGASQYPGCFEFSEESKLERWRASKIDHLEEFVNWARLLKTKRAVPAAGNHALLCKEQLELNTGNYVNTPQEAVDLLRQKAPEIEGLQMNPGDVWTSAEGLMRLAPPPDWSRREDHIRELSAQHRAEIEAGFAAEEEAPADLYDRFRSYFNGLLAADPSVAERIGIVTHWVVDGPNGGDWTIDFTRSSDWVSRGVPENWNLRLKWPEKLVWQGVSGKGIWDDLVLSFRLRLARQPDTYKKEFWTWLCKL
ncbi:MAG TPA: MBL fold metallo-hydrolase [Terriglobales bacterium]|nr:MBL fold metallo-hydrolase [Terriglobales bacterium]